jgi:molybdopterin molybdotransferase
VTPVPWGTARTLAYERVTPLTPHLVRLTAAVGSVLAGDLRAGCDLPPADTSAMDGWAVSGPPPWKVVGQVLAGRGGRSTAALVPSEAVVIATGAMLPAGATGIVRTERGLLTGDDLRLAAGAPSPPDLSDVRRRGHEAKAGDLLIRAGGVVRPTTVGLAAAAGHDALLVRPRPSVAVLVLGDELLDAGPPRDGAVRDALGVQLPAWVRALGGESGAPIRVPDDSAATLDAVQAGTDQVVVTTGGSAAGAADHLRATLARLDATIVVDTVDVRPGHPMLLAELGDGRHLVGLPGNPLAALAGVMTLLAPLLAGLSGAPPPAPADAVVADDVEVLPRGRRRGALLIPVARTPDGEVRPTGYAASSMLRGIAVADGFLLVPPDGLQRGERGSVAWFPWIFPGSR